MKRHVRKILLIPALAYVFPNFIPNARLICNYISMLVIFLVYHREQTLAFIKQHTIKSIILDHCNLLIFLTNFILTQMMDKSEVTETRVIKFTYYYV